MQLLNAVFGETGRVDLAQECARAALVFLYGFAAVRLTGRRVFGKWAALDIIASIIIGSNLSRALTGSAPLWGTLAATSVLLALHWMLAQAAARSPALSRLIEGRPAPLARDGRPEPATLRRWAISEADINEALRSHGLKELSEADLLLLEPSGSISVLARRG